MENVSVGWRLEIRADARGVGVSFRADHRRVTTELVKTQHDSGNFTWTNASLTSRFIFIQVSKYYPE